jgi:hypothetical protein
MNCGGWFFQFSQTNRIFRDSNPNPLFKVVNTYGTAQGSSVLCKPPRRSERLRSGGSHAAALTPRPCRRRSVASPPLPHRRYISRHLRLHSPNPKTSFPAALGETIRAGLCLSIPPPFISVPIGLAVAQLARID